eukprot:4880906-Ditylum_brightwellii.AAC.1
MSPFLAHSNYAFDLIAQLHEKFKLLGDAILNLMLCSDPKTIARMHSTFLVKGCSTTADFFCIQCIPLLKCASSSG